jgi:hypothetical protein
VENVELAGQLGRRLHGGTAPPLTILPDGEAESITASGASTAGHGGACAELDEGTTPLGAFKQINDDTSMSRLLRPAAWVAPTKIPVDLMVLEARRPEAPTLGRIPPQAIRATRRAVGLEAAVIDRAHLPIRALGAADNRDVAASVTGPAVLPVARLHKLGERLDQPTRLLDKDAHATYRLLVAISTDELKRLLSLP